MAMAKAAQDNELYERMRASGIRKKVALQLAELPGHVDGGKLVPRTLREAVNQLDATVSELRGHVGRSDRAAAGRKAARTRRAQSEKRSAAARKGARRRT